MTRQALLFTKDKTYTLKTTVTGTNKAVSWSSSNSSVASVDKNGKVTAKTKGTATITAKVDGVSASCKVTVNEPAKITIKLNKTKVTLGVGEPCTLKATVNPSQKVTWTSSNPKLVKVDSNGKLTVTKDIFNYFEVEQAVKITAKAGNATATCTVTTNYERVYPSTPSCLYTKKWMSMSAKAAVVSSVMPKLPEQNTKPKTVAKVYSSQKKTMVNTHTSTWMKAYQAVGTAKAYSSKSANAYSVKAGMSIKSP